MQWELSSRTPMRCICNTKQLIQKSCLTSDSLSGILLIYQTCYWFFCSLISCSSLFLSAYVCDNGSQPLGVSLASRSAACFRDRRCPERHSLYIVFQRTLLKCCGPSSFIHSPGVFTLDFVAVSNTYSNLLTNSALCN